jgi:hypothetical protein
MHANKKYYVRKEALVRNTRLWLQRGVRVAGIGVGLLKSQNTKIDSINSVERVGDGVVYKHGCRIRDRFAHCNWVMSRKFLESRTSWP